MGLRIFWKQHYFKLLLQQIIFCEVLLRDSEVAPDAFTSYNALLRKLKVVWEVKLPQIVDPVNYFL